MTRNELIYLLKNLWDCGRDNGIETWIDMISGYSSVCCVIMALIKERFILLIIIFQWECSGNILQAKVFSGCFIFVSNGGSYGLYFVPSLEHSS